MGRDFVVTGSDGVGNVTLPALSTVGGGFLLDGDFDEYVLLPTSKAVCSTRVSNAQTSQNQSSITAVGVISQSAISW